MLNIFVTRLPNLLMVMNMLVIVVLAFCLFFGGEAGAAERGVELRSGSALCGSVGVRQVREPGQRIRPGVPPGHAVRMCLSVWSGLMT